MVDLFYDRSSSWHFGLAICYMLLGGVTTITLCYLASMKEFLREQVYQIRCALMIALLFFCAVRACHLSISAVGVGEDYQVLGFLVSTLYSIGFWTFFCAKSFVVLVWLAACRNSTRDPTNRESWRNRWIAFIALMLGLPLAALCVLGWFRPDLAFRGTSIVILMASVAAAVGFSAAGLKMYASLRSVEYRAGMHTVAQHARRMSMLMALISIASFLIRATENILFAAEPSIFREKTGISTALQVGEYVFAELIPALALVAYVSHSTYQQCSEMRRLNELVVECSSGSTRSAHLSGRSSEDFIDHCKTPKTPELLDPLISIPKTDL